MIENLPESTQPLALLLICVIGAFPMWRKIFQTSKTVAFPQVEVKKMRVRVKTFGVVTERGITTMTNDIRMKCRECSKHFKRLEWMQNKACENPNCKCPEVAKLREAANQVITKASESSRVNIINVKRSMITPTGYDAEASQYMVETPDVMVIDMIVPKQFKGRRK